ncbi:MAG TPA: hypothetical protein VFC07_13475, partial [Verrucomicrobiae bacterium]|nr:hypothetical protein [Verrucomicrobiae bacterium]
SFNECKDVQELPGVYRVDPRLLRSLLDYLRDRDFNVGKFVSWGVPIFPWGANGSNCGDAFLVTLRRLDIADLVLPDIQRWIQDNKKGKWAFDRGLRRPADEFFQQQ